MRLKALDLEVEWPLDLPLLKLRAFLIDQIKIYGYPLRWAITSSEPSEKPDCFRQMTLEAVVIIDNSLEEE